MEYGKSSDIIQVPPNLIVRRTQRVQNLAYALIEAGIQPGDRVAIVAPNWYVLLEPLPVLMISLG